MKIICVMVSSVDGKTTKGDNPSVFEWTSKEDQKYFTDLIASSNVVIMGRKTYDAAKNIIKLKPGKLRVIVTSNPQKYVAQSIKGQLEFVSANPTKIVEGLINRGFDEILLVGGSDLNGSFLTENLIDELWLTIEPKLFGKGNSLAGEKGLEITLKLLEISQLNNQGTILLKYKIET